MSDPAPSPPAATCAICGKPRQPKFRAFCSKRCANVDLGRWLKEGYRVATDEAPAEGEGEGAGPGSTRQTG